MSDIPDAALPVYDNVTPLVSLADAHAAAITCAEQVPVEDLRDVLEALGLVPTAYTGARL
jgi:hypothetical protein